MLRTRPPRPRQARGSPDRTWFPHHQSRRWTPIRTHPIRCEFAARPSVQRWSRARTTAAGRFLQRRCRPKASRPVGPTAAPRRSERVLAYGRKPGRGPKGAYGAGGGLIAALAISFARFNLLPLVFTQAGQFFRTSCRTRKHNLQPTYQEQTQWKPYRYGTLSLCDQVLQPVARVWQACVMVHDL